MYSIVIKNIAKTLRTIIPSFFLIVVFSLFTVTSNAQEETPTITTTDAAPTPVEYQLPYPGILPGNPLYPLKVARDRIIWFLISDPLKKGEFDLLQADKRLSAGYLLFQLKPKQEKDIVSVISKGENYFFEALSQVAQATKQGQETSGLLGKMQTSSSKHVEILELMEKTATPSLRSGLQVEEKRVETLQKEVLQSINKK